MPGSALIAAATPVPAASTAPAALPSPAALDEIDGLLLSAVTDGGLASVTVPVRQLGQFIYSKSPCFADLELGVKATPVDLLSGPRC